MFLRLIAIDRPLPFAVALFPSARRIEGETFGWLADERWMIDQNLVPALTVAPGAF